jgi:hypothetical protein
MLLRQRLEKYLINFILLLIDTDHVKNDIAKEWFFNNQNKRRSASYYYIYLYIPYEKSFCMASHLGQCQPYKSRIVH